MRMQSPSPLAIFFRSVLAHPFHSKKRSLRSLVLLGLIGVAVTAVASNASSASSLGQVLLARTMLMIGASAAPVELKSTRVDSAFNGATAEASENSSATMLVERRGHTATRLSDGRVLIAGGENSTGELNQTEIYDPATATFSAAGNMTAARADHSATLLADGRVLVVGGRNGAGALTATEIFDPTTGTFSSGPAISVARAGHSATLFADGRIFIAGGDNGGTAEVFDPSSAAFNGVSASMNVARSMHSAALLSDGRVLLVGGRTVAGGALSSGEIFDPAGPSFSVIYGELTVARVLPHLRVLFEGKVQIIGGSDDGSMEIYDPQIETIGAYAHLLPESDTCAGLPGQVLASQTRAALFHHGQTDALLNRSGHTITELSDQALVVGGANSSGTVLSSISTLASSSASITTDKLDYQPGETVLISGRGFQPGETVRVKIHEDPHTPQERGFDIVADGDGNFIGEYLVQEYDLAMKFIVGARGLTSGATAQTTFTDARVINSASLTYNATTVSCPTGSCAVASPLAVASGATISASVTVTGDGNANNSEWRSTGWTFATSDTPPAPGSDGSCADTPDVGAGTNTATFNVTAPIVANTYFAHFRAYRMAGCVNQSGAQAPSGPLTITNAIMVEGVPTKLAFGVQPTSTDKDATITPAVTVRIESATGSLVTTSTRNISLAIGTNPGGGTLIGTTTVAAVGGIATFSNLAIDNAGTGYTLVASSALPAPALTTAASTSFNIIKLSQTITFGALADKTYGDAPFVVSGTGGASGNPVTFSASGNCTSSGLDGSTITITGAGSCTVTAAQAGNSNYNAATDVLQTFTINKANADCGSITGYTGVYDGAAHGATGTCIGVLSEALAGLDLGASFTNVPGGTANWTFTDVTGNYNDDSGSAAIVISKADATIVVNGYTGVYDGAAHGATGTATGVLSEALVGLDLGASFTNVPGGTANWTFTDVTGNYNDASGTAAIVISKADATIVVNGYTGVYDAAAHGATGTATGVLSEALTGLDLGASFTNVPGGTANWTFTDVTGNYNDASGSAAIVINKADATIVVNGFTGVYDAAAHGATGTATGVLSEALVGLDLGASFTNVPGGTANWTFTAVTGNYNDASDTAAIVISKADATIVVNGYTGVYDAAAHGATGTATGVLSEALAGLDLGASFTNVPGGTANWTFTDVTGNYNDDSGSAAIVINKADATIVVNGFTGVYDGAAHGATGTATGVLSEALVGLDLGASFTNVPGGTANWTFTDVTGNYNDASGTAAIVISKADATIVVNGYTGVYDGAAHGATGTATGVLSEALVGLDLGASFTNVPGGTANWTFTVVTGNYNDDSGSAAIVINKADATIVVNGFTGVYDAAAHGVVSSSATGVNNEPLSGLVIDPSTFTNVPGGSIPWSFTNQNYDDENGNATVTITKANAIIDVTPYSVIYDGASHTDTGTATGILSESLAGLDLSATTHTNAGSYNADPWIFTDVTGNYNDASGTVDNSIGQASSTVTVTCPGAPQTYTGAAQTPCTAEATGVGMSPVDVTASLVYASNINVGTATADASWPGDTNHTGNTASSSFTISKANQTITWANPAAIVYGTPLGATQLNATVVGVPGGSPAGALTYTPPAGTILNAGNGQTLGVDAAATSNYNAAHKDVLIDVNKAPLSITADNKSMLFGSSAPPYTVTYAGFVVSDTPAGLVGTLSFTVKVPPALVTTVVVSPSTSSGTYTIMPSGLTSSNYDITFVNGTLAIDSWWTLQGFFQPVDMGAFVLNTVKGGSTVPLKFKIFAGTPGPTTERKSVSDVQFGSVQVAEYNCAATPGYESPVDVINTGNTSLRYDTGGQFIQNWQTPKAANRCYQVRMTALDGSHIDAFFKTK